MVDAENGMLGLEWIEGASVRRLLGGGDEGLVEGEEDGVGEGNGDAGSSVRGAEGGVEAFGIQQGASFLFDNPPRRFLEYDGPIVIYPLTKRLVAI